MVNLFSTFDPNTWLVILSNWSSSLLAVLALVPLFWVTESSVLVTVRSLTSYVESELKALLGKQEFQGSVLLPGALFAMILFNNSLGMFPYIFTPSSHLVFSLSMALPLWLGHSSYCWLKGPKGMLAHLVPLGTPSYLMVFMVVIEVVSNLIRPLTLSVRLAANMTAGHLLLSLLGTPALGGPLPLSGLVVVFLVLLVSLEVAVALIQAYVFSVLSTLYFSEASSSAS